MVSSRGTLGYPPELLFYWLLSTSNHTHRPHSHGTCPPCLTSCFQTCTGPRSPSIFSPEEVHVSAQMSEWDALQFLQTLSVWPSSIKTVKIMEKSMWTQQGVPAGFNVSMWGVDGTSSTWQIQKWPNEQTETNHLPLTEGWHTWMTLTKTSTVCGDKSWRRCWVL